MSTTTATAWARRLDWLERILAVLAVPLLGLAFAWGQSVEARLNGSAAEIGLLKQAMKHADEGREEILKRLDESMKLQVDVLQRLSRIEALVSAKETPR